MVWCERSSPPWGESFIAARTGTRPLQSGRGFDYAVWMQVRSAWPKTRAEAEALQERLRPKMDLTADVPDSWSSIAGLDVAYETGGQRLTAAVAVLDRVSLEVISSVTVTGAAPFDYIPGLFAFRELPALLSALEALEFTPDVLLCDGHGLAHPRRFGLACHLGVLTGVPTIGVAKTRLVGSYAMPGSERGAWTPVYIDGQEMGRALRTRANTKPVLVSVGNRVQLDTACEVSLEMTPFFRTPEPIRQADQLARRTMREHAD